MTSGNGRQVTYTPGNKVSQIIGNAVNGVTPRVDFAYGADGHRVLQSLGTGSGEERARTIYVGLGATGKSLYERTAKGSSLEHVQFLYAAGVHGGSAFAVRVTTTDKPTPQTKHSLPTSSAGGPKATLRYQHFDHLGSIVATTDDEGRVTGGPSGDYTYASVMAFDAWGARRDPGGTATGGFSLQPGHREFTGHETIPEVGLTNMNGRVYDPALGRFLTPDPNVQFLANLQSYNRYSYALNNPLRYTDPTGYFLFDGFDTLVGFGITIAAIATCAASSGATCAVLFMLAATAYNAASMAISQHASFGDIYASTVMGLMGSGFGMVAGAGLGNAVGQNVAAQMVAGAASAAATNVFMTKLSGGSLSEDSILMSASTGALASAVAWSKRTNPVSQKSAPQKAGGSAGESNTGGRKLIVYNDLVEGGDRGFDAAARMKYEAALKRNLGRALDQDLSDAIIVRAPDLGALRDHLTLAGEGTDVISYMHVVDGLSPTGLDLAAATAENIASWLPRSTNSVTIAGCTSMSLAGDLSSLRGGMKTAGTPVYLYTYDWVSNSNPSEMVMWQSAQNFWAGNPPQTETSPFQFVSFPQ